MSLKSSIINTWFYRVLVFTGLIRVLRRLHALYEWDEYAQLCWSQEGEDMILQRIYSEKSTGFYVDVGAHHPKRFSNTYMFYRRGWCGINIDPLPGIMEQFRQQRPHDINIECGVGQQNEKMMYYMFNEPALNGFCKDLSEFRNSQENNYKIIGEVLVPVKSLSEILQEWLPPEQDIDFLTVDAEGFDLDVLKSNDWQKYRPKFVLVEILSSKCGGVDYDEVTVFMTNNNYIMFAKCFNTVFFKDVYVIDDLF